MPKGEAQTPKSENGNGVDDFTDDIPF